MKTILGLRKQDYLAKVGVLLIAAALIVGTLACGPTPKYSLTMAVAPPGSGSAIDQTGASPYAAGTVVNIEAVDTAGLTFDNWTAPAGTFGNVTAAVTTFTMPAQNVTVTANFG